MSKARDIADSTTTLDVDGGTIKLDGNYPVGTNNVALGNTALDSIASGGTRNTALGFAAGTALTTQDYNVFVGSYSGDGATGSSNVAVGDVTLRNTSGSFNTAIGGEALTSNTTASDNTAVGYQALYANTTASGSVAVGRASAASNTTGVNTSVGDYSLNSNTTGSNNTALGKQALQLNTTATSNTAVGYQAGYSTTTGGLNTFIGSKAGYSSTGNYNTFVGHGTIAGTGDFGSGQLMTTGSKNTIIGGYNGNQGGLDIRTSSNNIVLSDGDGNPALHLEELGSGFKNTWRPVYEGNATGYGSGAAGGVWHQITAVDFNALNYSPGSVRVYITYANANPTYGYTGIVMCDIPNGGSNSTYTGPTTFGTDASGTAGTQIPTTVSTHTGTSGLVFELKMDLTGSTKYLSIRCNVSQTSNSAVFGIPQMYVLVNGWIGG